MQIGQAQVEVGAGRRLERPRRATVRGYAAAVIGVAGMTAALRLLPAGVHISNISMLYLLVVIGAAVWFGSGPAIAASVLSFLAFDYFFVHPVHTFTVADPAEWLALLLFLVTATITGQLTARLHDRAEEAQRRERETAALADASWAVASQVDRAHALAEVLRRIGEMVPAESAAILTLSAAGEPEVVAGWTADGSRPDFSRDSAAAAIRAVASGGLTEGGADVRGDWLRALSGLSPGSGAYLPLATEPQQVLGVLYLDVPAGRVVSPTDRRLVESLANHAAVVLERDRLARAELGARALREADRLKTALLGMVSHDFRSPLTSIKTSVTALLEEGAPWDPAVRRDLLVGIDGETDRLNRMVGNILALSRLEADAWRPQREATSPAELVGAALGSLSAGQNRRVEVRLEDAPTEIWLDQVQFVQVLGNLVENALKYSPAPEPVEVVVRTDAGSAVIEVLDRGPGLPRGAEERVFEPFFRAPELRESAQPGVGIGLAVCRGLVQAHGGKLTGLSRPGGGTIFRVRVPLATPEAGPDPVAS